MKDINYRTYLVGGAVRDELLGLENSDRDWVVVGTTPQALLEQGFVEIGEDFPCFLHPHTREEYALARTRIEQDGNTPGRHDRFGPDVTLEQDLYCRDLTINAIAKSPEGSYLDPYNGIDDIENRQLRHVSEAFRDDPIRILRVARFAARYHAQGFKVHESTMDLMRDMVAKKALDQVTAERVWKELSRAITTPKPSVFFEVLRECGALNALLPELDTLFGTPQPEAHHPEIDTGIHVMMVVDLAKELFDDPVVTWAALMHDLGKGVTPKSEWPKHINHESLGVPLIDDVSERFRVPNSFAEIAKLVSEHHLRCHRIEDTKRGGKIMRLLEALDGIRRPERVELFVKACEADARGRKGRENTPYPQADIVLGALKAAKDIDVKPLLEKGYEGEELAYQIRSLRIQNIAQDRKLRKQQ